MRAWLLLLAITLAPASAYGLMQYATANYSMTTGNTSFTVSAYGQDTGTIFVEFPAKVLGDRFTMNFKYMIQSKNPEYDPALFVRVYPVKQDMNKDWINTRTMQECYYYTASNGEIIPVGGTPLLKGRVEAYGRTGCVEKECDFYREEYNQPIIQDGQWYSKSIPVECNNDGRVWVVVEMPKKTPDWVKWQFADFKVDSTEITFNNAAPEENQTQSNQATSAASNNTQGIKWWQKIPGAGKTGPGTQVVDEVLAGIAVLLIIGIIVMLFLNKKKEEVLE